MSILNEGLRQFEFRFRETMEGLRRTIFQSKVGIGFKPSPKVPVIAARETFVGSIQVIQLKYESD
jgi:hypothetical protein